MTWRKLFEDSFTLGLAAGLVSMTVFYYVLTALRMALIQYYGNPYVMAPPRVQLFTILLNVISFRFLVLNYDRDRTGRGLLFITLLASFVYFFIYFPARHIA